VRPAQEDFGMHSGLGLAIARAILDGHGGSIVAEDRPGGSKGARFRVTLPLASTEPHDEPGEGGA
jgi:two-component system sensor histidine kinase ChvG